MPISCYIKLCYPPDKLFRPGQPIFGRIFFTVAKEMYAMKIVVSLKGIGRLCVKENKRIKRGRREQSHFMNVTYVDIDHYINDKPEYMLYYPGQYKENFTFRLPENIAPSLDYSEKISNTISVRCKVMYYIRIRFDRPNYEFNKYYKKNILVEQSIKLSKWLSSKSLVTTRKVFELNDDETDDSVTVKTELPRLMASPNEKFLFNCAVINNCSLPVNIEEIKLEELYQFKTMSNIQYRKYNSIVAVNFNRDPIESKRNRLDFHEIIIPPYVSSYSDSKMISRSYILTMIFGFNGLASRFFVKIPLVFGETVENAILDSDLEPKDTVDDEREVMTEYNNAELNKENISIDLPIGIYLV